MIVQVTLPTITKGLIYTWPWFREGSYGEESKMFLPVDLVADDIF